MNHSGLSRIGVVGSGTMGSGIAQVCAQSGFYTKVSDVSAGMLDHGMEAIQASLAKLVAGHEKSGGERGISAAACEAALGRLSTHIEIAELLDCELIVEAVTEQVAAKEAVCRELLRLGYAGLLASNTSSISITRLGAASGRPERFMGMHFMNPVPLQPGVEVIRGLLTADATAATIEALCLDLGKTPVRAEDKPGFGINRMWIPFINEAARVVDEGVMAPDEADKCTLCLGHKMGPLATADLVGLDIIVSICGVLAAELGPAYLPAPLLRRLVDAGQLGAKRGIGFYIWEDGKPGAVNPAVARYRRG